MRRCSVLAEQWLTAGALVLAAGGVARAGAQAALAGTVRTASAAQERVVAAQVTVPSVGLRTTTDSAGAFTLAAVAAGSRWIVIRAPGFDADSFLVAFIDGESTTRDFQLHPRLTELNKVKVTAPAATHVPAKLVGFFERRQAGIGRFFDREAIAKWESRGRTADMLASLPGVDVKWGNTNKAWAVSGRAVSASKCAFCKTRSDSALDVADLAAGARAACYMDVYVDGVPVYSSTSRGAPLFDVNSIPPSQIEAVEVYLSAAQIPAAYNRTSGGCGVMLIWTRV